jgi:hypothetical protein
VVHYEYLATSSRYWVAKQYNFAIEFSNTISSTDRYHNL